MKKYRSRIKRRAAVSRTILLVVGLGLLAASLVVGLRSLTQYLAQPPQISNQTDLLGVPLGGLTLEEAQQRIEEAFSVPVELTYQGARMQFLPAELGFQLDIRSILSQISLTRAIPFRSWFWGQSFADNAQKLEIQYSLDENQL